MNRKFKALGLALFAAFALSAIGAQAASADIFKSAADETTVTAHSHTEEHKFTYGANDVTCGVTNFSGTQKGKEVTSITITPTYDECVFGGSPAEVRTNHCGYLFTSTTTTEHEETHARVGIECEKDGEHIEIEVPAFGHCVLTILPRTETEEEDTLIKTTRGVTYTNVPEEEDQTTKATTDAVTVTITAEVTVTRDNDSGNFFCGLLAHEGLGTYTGNSLLTGYEDKGTPNTESGVTFTESETATTEKRGTTHWSWTEGANVDIEVVST